MKKYLIVILVSAVLVAVTAFNQLPIQQSKIKTFKLPVTQPNRQYDERSLSEAPPVSVMELFTPPFADGFTIGATLLGQAFLVNLSFVLNFISFFFAANPVVDLYTIFSVESMNMAISFTILLLMGIVIFDNLPFKASKDVARDTRFYSLKILGRKTSVIKAIFLSLILAGKYPFFLLLNI